MVTTEFDVSQLRSPVGERLLAAIGTAFARLAGRWRAMRNRRSVAQLLEWDSRMLGDIGLTQGDVASAMSAPIGEDPSYRLSVLSVERRAALRAAARERLAYAASTKVTPIHRAHRPHRVLEI